MVLMIAENEKSPPQVRQAFLYTDVYFPLRHDCFPYDRYEL